jgi:hypothetical protein
VGQVVTQPGPVPRRVAAHRTHTLHELTGTDNVDTDAAPGTGHRTREHRAAHRTSDARIPDTYRTPDTGCADTGHADADGGRGQGDQGTVASGHPRTTTPPARRTVLLWAAARAAFGNTPGGEAARPSRCASRDRSMRRGRVLNGPAVRAASGGNLKPAPAATQGAMASPDHAVRAAPPWPVSRSTPAQLHLQFGPPPAHGAAGHARHCVPIWPYHPTTGI